jgi:beta-fructofuranosidase
MLAHDPHRPRYHFLPEAIATDPNGLIQWKAASSLLSVQLQRPFPRHDSLGHAVSVDLCIDSLPIALAPTPNGSGQGWRLVGARNNNGTRLFFTGFRPQVQCLAWSDDDLLTWHKHRQPVLTAPPADLDIVGRDSGEWRDPWVWQEADRWYMLIGSGIRNVGGTALLYESRDLFQWTYLHPILIGDQGALGTVWECPNLFPLGNRHVLLISILPEFRHTHYLTGDYIQQRFHPAIRGKTDHGAYFYAAQTMRDESGRRLMWGWIKEGRDAQSQRAAGWSGVMSLPRVLDLLPDGTLSMTAAPELMALRDQHFHWADLVLSSYTAETAPGFQGWCLEISAEFELIDAEKFGFWIHCSPNGDERTLIA